MICLCRAGGTLQVALLMAEHLAKRPDIRLAFVGSKDAMHDGVDKLRSLGVSVLLVSSGKTPRQNLFQTLNIFNYLRIAMFVAKFHPDIVHYPAEHAWNLPLHLMLRRFPMTDTIHDPTRHAGEESRIYSALSSAVITMSDNIIILSKSHLPQFGRYSKSPEFIDVIHHGPLGLASDAPDVVRTGIVLFFGRFLKYKGIEVLIDAFTAVSLIHSRAQLVLAGKGQLSDVAIKSAAHPKIKIIQGWLSDEQLQQLVNDSEIVVVPYIEASQSGVVAMAQACGRPVIVTRVGGLPEQIKSGVSGDVVSPGNAAELAGAINVLLSDFSRVQHYAFNAKTLYATQFSWQTLATLTVDSYRKTIDNRRKYGKVTLYKTFLKMIHR